MKRKKNVKAVDPDDTLLEVLKCLGEKPVRKIPAKWMKCVLVSIFKNRIDVLCCSKYRRIKLMRHTMKRERVVEAEEKK